MTNGTEAAPAVGWVKVVAGIVVFFGVLVSLAAHPTTAAPAMALLDMIYWPIDGAETADAPATRLLAAIGGGVMTGWGVMIWLSADMLAARTDQLRRLLLWSAGAWLTVDSLGSIAAGAWLNVIFNLVFAALVVWALRGSSRAPAASAPPR